MSVSAVPASTLAGTAHGDSRDICASVSPPPETSCATPHLVSSAVTVSQLPSSAPLVQQTAVRADLSTGCGPMPRSPSPMTTANATAAVLSQSVDKLPTSRPPASQLLESSVTANRDYFLSPSQAHTESFASQQDDPQHGYPLQEHEASPSPVDWDDIVSDRLRLPSLSSSPSPTETDASERQSVPGSSKSQRSEAHNTERLDEASESEMASAPAVVRPALGTSPLIRVPPLATPELALAFAKRDPLSHGASDAVRFASSLDDAGSLHRTSVTVTHHPLDDDPAPRYPGPEATGRAAAAAIAPAMVNKGNASLSPSAEPAYAKPPVFARDFESPGRATEEMQEWRRGDALSARSDVTTSSVAAETAVCVPVAAACFAGLKGVHGVVASAVPPTTENGKTIAPTPYPVTSTSSLKDWSSMPRLGFAAPADPAAAQAEARSLPQRDQEERKREDKWYSRCRGVSLLASATPEAVVRLRSTACKYGIPHHLRGVMWLTLTGMALKVDENEYFCAKLLRRNGYVTGPNADAIAADVQRTFPGHPYFSEQDVGIYKLTNVLHAVCWRNPLLSYCQSFNFLAAFLLLVLDDEERVFWLLLHMFEELLPNDFYGETLLGANVEQAVLEALVQQRLPRVAAKFHATGLQVHTLVANWVMSLFVNVFPPSTALRMWDYFFCRTPNPGERTPAHLEITLAVLKYLDDAGSLVGEDAGDLLVALREKTACLYDASAVIQIAQTFAITPKELHQLRREAKPAVVRNMKDREQARMAEHERRLARELQMARAASSTITQV